MPTTTGQLRVVGDLVVVSETRERHDIEKALAEKRTDGVVAAVDDAAKSFTFAHDYVFEVDSTKPIEDATVDAEPNG